ncbi:hypothetical protein AC578_4363 [Pseudocercospora eumusae]|uniref:Uncharacterized protein n=1 Tax=Pseudocercospora eumusae TaxID=321146 RepID=A0A139H5N6_9PEZI|nr:hypothetical protein AC578_4363 [Pseudocercospora eumusae]
MNTVRDNIDTDWKSQWVFRTRDLLYLLLPLPAHRTRTPSKNNNRKIHSDSSESRWHNPLHVHSRQNPRPGVCPVFAARLVAAALADEDGEPDIESLATADDFAPADDGAAMLGLGVAGQQATNDEDPLPDDLPLPPDEELAAATNY